MIELEQEQNTKTRCLLVGEPENTLTELQGLVKTLGMEVAHMVTLVRMEPNPVYGIGKGKATEIAQLAKEHSADCIIFDFSIEPTKQRNWEKLAKLPVFDRQEVILRIFSQRAQTKEAVLQVQLAQLTYALPRLAHMYGDMARQRGGNYGSKGSGEKQLELDQRQIREKIRQVKKELEQVVINRETQRKKREKVPLPTCALVGYTNAGKSSLLNALTGANVFVENKLFATLDPTTRKLSFREGKSILLTDTVGFISNLPHSLINSFKSTLEETIRSQLLLIVIDASDPNAIQQYKTVCSVLEEIKADNIKHLVILNKMDLVDDTAMALSHLDAYFPDAIKISTKEQTGFNHLIDCIANELFGHIQQCIIPTSDLKQLEDIRKRGILYTEEWLDDGIHITARIN
ncbi:MAG: GTPase HflX [Treponema sp.]|nr:GTPase HflX [Treponema sp.]